MTFSKHRYLSLTGVAVAALLFCACEYDTRDLGPTPTASFTVTPVSGQVNKYVLNSTSQNAFMYEWDKGAGRFERTKPTDTVYFPDMGDYTVKLRVYGHGGMDSASQVIKVAADDPAAMTPLKALTNKSSKTWILEPAAGALWVGPNTTQAWWSSGQGDVADRPCLFNDEYTFSFNGNFVFDDKGDIRVDDEQSAPWPKDIGLPIGCASLSQIPDKYKAWGSGSFKFTIIDNNKLRVIGKGAHLGLYKAGENDTSPAPEDQITYEIVSYSPTKLVVRKVYGWGVWRFTFVPKP